MHEVDVPAAAVTMSALPTLGICVQHALPATGTRVRTFGTRTRPWTLVLGGTVVSLALRETVRGPLPVCHACVNHRRALAAATVLAWAAAVVLAGVALGTRTTPLLVVAGVATLGALVVTGRGNAIRAGGVLSKDQERVRLRHVHPDFAAAVRARVEAATMPPSYLHADAG